MEKPNVTENKEEPIKEIKKPRVKETNYSICASHREIFNISFWTQIIIILYGILSIIDFGINILTIYVRIIGLLLFVFQLIINYNIHIWSLPHLDHPLCIPHRSNCTAWVLFHFIMPIIIGRWPELLWNKITSPLRTTYPSLIFWASSRSGTTTFTHHLKSLPNNLFIGPLSSNTSPLAFNKEGAYFISTYGCNQHYRNYSMLYPMCGGKKNKIYFDGYPEYHCFPFIRDRLYDINPNMKFIFFVRNPCDKVISQWKQLQDTYLQVTRKNSFSEQELNERFRASLNVIQSEKYENIYNFFVSIKIDEYPAKLKENIADWLCECVLGRAMFGRDLTFWFEKFNNIQNWLILDMKTVLKNEHNVKFTLEKICEFVGVESENEWIKNWMPNTLKLNQNNIIYKPPNEYMMELKEFYEKDQQILYEFIEEKGIQFICDKNLI